jgi:integrative and conjugative element protein (TIGR02256 family)
MTPSLFVHRGVLARFAHLPHRPYEVGGWLLGYWADDESSIFLTHATPPASRGTPLGVRISGRGHREKFDHAWGASGGLVTFLGDWHTHPGSPPLPSARDRAALRKLATDPSYGTPEPLMAILTTPRWPWHEHRSAVAFYLRTANEEVNPLAAVVTDELPTPAAAVPDWQWPPRRPRW